jgi:hypothetical protein
MTYGPKEVSSDLAQIRDRTAGFETRARLEHHLLMLLQNEGTAAVSSLLLSLPDHRFRRVDDGTSVPDARHVSEEPGSPPVSVATNLGLHSAFVHVNAEEEPNDRREPDPRHRAFYDIWESMTGVSDSAAAKLDPKRKAVFLVGLLEAEVGNGGLGQYLANTEGAHLEDTMRCLARIGAERSHALLDAAAKLAAGAQSYLAAWDARPRDFDRLDDEFLESGEDLAGMTADVFLAGNVDKGSD